MPMLGSISRRRPVGRLWKILAVVCLLWAGPRPANSAPPPAPKFEPDIRPLLKTHCFHCHGEEEEIAGKLDLRLVRLMRQGGDSGPAVVAGQPANSLLLQRIVRGEMPPKGKKVSAAEIELLTRWIEQGAATARPEPDSPAADPWTAEERSWWAFRPVERPALPQVGRADLVSTPIDAFLLQRLEANGLTFAPPADRATLVRRLAFDLWGMPPTPECVDEAVSDSSPDWYERLVDRFLAHPAYGERWARHWLDPVGYADSDGYTEEDRVRPWAYRYRDYVIRSFNADKPWSDFILEQLAGDELLNGALPHATPENADRLIATGFLRMAPDGTGEGGVDQNVARNDVIAETIKIVSSSLLGVTVGCAQCHEHRYDPIAQADYYRMRAIFEPALDWKNWRERPARLVSLWTPADYEQAAKVDQELQTLQKQRETDLDAIVTEIFEREVAKLPAEQQQMAREGRPLAADKRTPEQTQLFKDHPSLNVDRGSAILYDGQRINEFNAARDKLYNDTRAKRPADDYVACLTEPQNHLPATHLFFRGDFNQPRQTLPPADLSVLPAATEIASDDPAVFTSGRRLAWARQLTSGQHPLVARVLVNRIWMHHFGRGIVPTAGDFGRLGERPSHPELLDWLADAFVASGWRLKTLQRTILLSNAYRQSSLRDDAQQALDPDNRWLGRMNSRRLEAEAVRDAVLEVAGSRTHTMFGPATPVNPDEFGQVIVGNATRDGNGILVAAASDDPQHFRRSIYIQVRRSMPLGVLEPFDVATTSPNCEVRSASTAAPQALLMMNNQWVVQQAQRFAARVLAEAGEERTAQVRRAWRLAYSADPAPEEASAALELIEAARTHFEQLAAAKPHDPNSKTPPPTAPGQQALAVFCQALLSSNRFLYVD